ncbi:MAG: hypothetical protein IT355_12460 [Gemmatimonadaceae bacterium]|nr:hypothetical protein [Gemmatimonadaceae bacterium]
MVAIAASIPARLRGAWQERSLDYDAAVELTATALQIAYDPQDPKVVEVSLDSLDGATLEHGVLSLCLATGKKVVLSDSAYLDGLRLRLEAAVCAFPAQTLSLRAFGSERSAPGSDHDRWFEALLTARRVAEESRTIETQRRAFDAGRLGRHAQLTREGWAADRFEAAADRRALAAELEEIAAPYGSALFRLEAAALALRHASDATQFGVWRGWAEAVQGAFRSADETWSLMVPVLADSRGVRGAFWRRLLRRGGAGGAT